MIAVVTAKALGHVSPSASQMCTVKLGLEIPGISDVP